MTSSDVSSSFPTRRVSVWGKHQTDHRALPSSTSWAASRNSLPTHNLVKFSVKCLFPDILGLVLGMKG